MQSIQLNSEKQFEIVSDETFNSTGESTKMLHFAPGLYKRLHVGLRYKVTDVDISAGENVRGATVRLRIGEGDDNCIVLERNEMDRVIDILQRNDAGCVIDADPTTATWTIAEFIFEAPEGQYFDFLKHQNPRIEWTLNPGAEWGAASAFEATMFLCPTLYKKQGKGNGIYIHREKNTTSTQHVLYLGELEAHTVHLYLEDGSYLSKLEMEGIPVKGDPATKKHISWVHRPEVLLANWRRYKELAANAAGVYQLMGERIPRWSTRKLKLELSTTSPVLCFTVGVKK